MSKPKQDTTGLFVHEPLPYIVELTTSLTDDDVPQLHSIKVTAYSVMEAAMQAAVQLTGSAVVDDQNARVTAIRPDVAGWFKVIQERLRQQKARP